MKPNYNSFLKDECHEYRTEGSGDGHSSPDTAINKYVIVGELLKSLLNLCRPQFSHL